MTSQPVIEIDTSEDFQHLANAPIVEAVIHWRARGDRRIQQHDLDELKSTLPDYPTIKSQHEMGIGLKHTAEGVASTHTDTWDGFRAETNDGRNIAQFTRGGFVFSRLRPYEDWNRFADEADRLWQIYAKFTEPSEVERLGLRFINRIKSINPGQLDKIMELPPRKPELLQLPIKGFLHRSLFYVPGHPYNVNVTQTIQPRTPPESDSIGLILDIDVFTTAAVDLNKNTLDERLSEMRWLKNKMFFSLLTPQTIDRYKENQS